MAEFADAFRRILSVFSALEIPHAVGGSMASSVHGTARYTRDIDIVAQLPLEKVEPFVREIEAEFSITPEEVAAAVEAKRSFNAIHFATAYKFDFFPLSDKPYDLQQLSRRTEAELDLDGETVRFPVASAEDTILTKLVWFRLGGETSETQINDVKGVLALKRDELDREYLARWARHLEVDDLLEALTEPS